ncbi:lytic transglycosylase domain-containing protein [Sandaracinobacter neustonicus]|uniref:Lytic transglycosylase domain-containing protein n=1 Tax=Sandaracinobacter neustonicus TaxID=1715348 RepID=A0A501XVY7_9SPHN|nr:lytic transglycosylase domain-containing protein [Sandaracinobacter neustonicus]TPE64740.1 lytic transglycosylase domain-containing protein [Sandaracinobacter neustonicus]
MPGFRTLFRSGLLLLCALGTGGAANARPASELAGRVSYDDAIAEASRRFGIPQSWIRAVMRFESAGNPRAISIKGAMGLMQLMPGTWEELRLRYGLGNDPFHPFDNILAGTGYLRDLHDRYGSPGFLAAYNAGPGRYEQHLRGRPLPLETRAYVAAVAPSIEVSEARTGGTMAAIDPYAWRRSAIFAASSRADISAKSRQEPDETAASTTHTDGRSDETADRNLPLNAGPPIRPTGGLFIARSDPESRP